MARVLRKNNLQYTAEALKALAHPGRLEILGLLCKAPQGKLTVKSIYESLKVQQAVVSRHLIILKKTGIVYRMQDGKKTFYGLRTKKKNIELLLGCFSE